MRTQRILAGIAALALAASVHAQGMGAPVGPPSHAQGNITIAPSGDMTGQMDYDALQAALLDARNGTTIQLEEGIFYFNYPLVATNFRGTLKGAGQELTILTTAGELPAFITGDIPPQLNPPSVDNPWPELLSFVDGKFTLSDMTFQITDPVPARFFFYDVEFTVLQSIVAVIGADTGGQVHSSIKRVGFEGAEGAWLGYNIIHAVLYAGNVVDVDNMPATIPVIGMHQISESSIEGTYAGVTAFNMAENASLIIRDNTIADVTNGHLNYGSSGRIDFFQNEVSVQPSLAGGDGYGVSAIQGFLYVPFGLAHPPMTLTVRDNVFFVEEGFAGVLVEDLQVTEFGTPPSMFVEVRNNEIIADSAVYGVYGNALSGPIVSQNDFLGSVLDAGLYLELTSDAKCIMNGMQALDAGTARCLLWDDTHDNLFIGPDAFNDVLDMTDNQATPEYDGLNRIISTGH